MWSRLENHLCVLLVLRRGSANKGSAVSGGVPKPFSGCVLPEEASPTFTPCLTPHLREACDGKGLTDLGVH